MSLRTIIFRYTQQLRRFPIGWWAATLAVAIIAGTVVTQGVNRANAAASEYGDVDTVYIATRSMDAGTSLTTDDFTQQRRPRSFRPEGALTSPPNGFTVTPIAKGETLTSTNTSTAGLSATAAQLHKGEVGIAIPFDEKGPELAIGDSVSLLATLSSADPTVESPTLVVAPKARVIHLSERAATMAVLADQAPKVAGALTKGTVTITIITP